MPTSESGSDRSSDDMPAFDNSEVQMTPKAKPRSHASGGAQIFPMSPAWIKKAVKQAGKLEKIGMNVNDISHENDVVLFSIPAGVKVEDLDGKQITFPSQAGARSSIDACRLEVVCDPTETNADLHLLGVAGGTAGSKAVSQVYSLQIPLPDVPADEEPVDETIIDALLSGAPYARSAAYVCASSRSNHAMYSVARGAWLPCCEA